jgi:predicted hotdog family 3-hydroxylacyl-ACP dehydratase
MGKDIPIEEIIPHRKPMVMIDALLETAPTRGVAEKTFLPEEYGVHGDQVSELALIECAAQTVAAFLGYGKAALTAGSAGFLVGLSSFSFSRSVLVGERLVIEAQVNRSFEGILAAQGKVFVDKLDGECIAQGELKIHLRNGKM